MEDGRLKAAAQVGDINLLYTLIQEDPYVLERMDEIPFVETPLHVAASSGHLQFATEITRLKPSFAWKLNQQGFSPIHHALQQGHNRMVLRFVDINKDLVRVKGKEGWTPLHFVSQTGEIDLLADFLSACPDSIEDVTVRGETALHIAVNSGQYEALQVLVGWLKRIRYGGSRNLEKTILNWKDDEGNTILHISAHSNDIQALGLLIESEMDLKAKNLQNLTAFDMAASGEIRNKLVAAGALRGSDVTDASTLVDILRSNTTVMDKIVIYILRLRRDLTEDQRNCFLVVAALAATANYQSALSPPGSFYQAEAGNGANNVNTTSLNSTLTATQGMAGKSVMSNGDFLAVYLCNVLSLLVSTVAIYILTPAGRVRILLFTSLSLFASCYLCSMLVISPTSVTTNVTYSLFVLFYILSGAVHFIYTRVYKRLKRWGPKRVIESSYSNRGNRW